MTTAQLRKSIHEAAETLARYAATQNKQCAIYSDGSISGILEPNTWEERTGHVFELCRLSSWRDGSKSEAWNARALTGDIKMAIEKGVYRLSEIATLS